MTMTSGPTSPPLPSLTAPGDHPGTVTTAPAVMVDRWDWLGGHGGAGVSTLRAGLGAGRDITRAVVDMTGATPSLILRPDRTVVVCRTHAFGLYRAQEIAAAHAARSCGAQLFGLVLVADAPGKLPRPLDDLARLVSGAYLHLWRVPWVEAWRLGAPPDLTTAPSAVRRLDEELRFAADNLYTVTAERETQ